MPKFQSAPLRSSPLCYDPKFRSSTVPFSHGVTFQRIALYVSAGATAATCLICIMLAALHIMYYTKPVEQKLILRAIFIPAIFCIFALGCVDSYSAALYLEPIAKIFESLSLCSLFLLCLTYIVPDLVGKSGITMDELCQQLGARATPTKGSALWLKRTFICVFQYPIVVLATIIATEITSAILCPTSKAASKARLVISIIAALSTSIIITAIVMCYGRVKQILKPTGVGWKLACFKSLVLLATTEPVVFSALNWQFLKDATPKLTYFDWIIGVPAVLIGCEMVLFALLFVWAFSPMPYRRLGPSGKGFGERLVEAMVGAFDFRDVVRGGALAFGGRGGGGSITTVTDGDVMRGQEQYDETTEVKQFNHSMENAA